MLLKNKSLTGKYYEEKIWCNVLQNFSQNMTKEQNLLLQLQSTQGTAFPTFL